MTIGASFQGEFFLMMILNENFELNYSLHQYLKILCFFVSICKKKLLNFFFPKNEMNFIALSVHVLSIAILIQICERLLLEDV